MGQSIAADATAYHGTGWFFTLSALSKKSYTSSLFEQGINKIAQKVGEEAVELVIESKDSNNDL